MKYIKTYEKIKTPKYQIDDIVEVYSESSDIFNDIMRITHEPKPIRIENNKKDYLYLVISLSQKNSDIDDPGNLEEIWEDEIVRKLTKEEADLLLAAKKYNL